MAHTWDSEAHAMRGPRPRLLLILSYCTPEYYMSERRRPPVFFAPPLLPPFSNSTAEIMEMNTALGTSYSTYRSKDIDRR